MKKSQFIFLFVVIQFQFVFAANEKSLDDFISPEEIWLEIESAENSSIDLFPGQRTGLFDLFRSTPVEPPQKEWNAFTLQESQENFGTNWIKNFDLVVVINKAITGPNAQRAEIYWQGQLFGKFKVSTGREKQEISKSGRRYFSNTPTGWYHPTWMSRNHISKTWEVPMPYAVFFNGGIATHAAPKDSYEKLGSRASGGCVRLHPAQAKLIFESVLKAGKGLVPEFTRTGEPVLDNKGMQKFSQNWRSIFIVINRNY